MLNIQRKTYSYLQVYASTVTPSRTEELVPHTGEDLVPHTPHMIPGYGSRGWCRVEYFIFSLAAEMRGRKAQLNGRYSAVPGTGVELYGIKRDGSLAQYSRVQVIEQGMPRQGALSNPADKAKVQDLEDTMIEAYVPVVVEVKCKAGAGGFVVQGGGCFVDLTAKMIRDCHVEALCEAVNKYEVEALGLGGNQLGDAGAEAIAAMVRTNRSLTVLHLGANKISAAGWKAVQEAAEERAALDEVEGRIPFQLDF